MNNECYRVLPSQGIQAYLNKKSLVASNYDTCLATNNCFVYYLDSGQVVILPNNYLDNGANGILFENKRCFNDCIENDSFPIQNEKMAIEEKYKDEIIHIDKTIDSIIGLLTAKFTPRQKEFKPTNQVLGKLLRVLKQKKLTEKELVYAALTLGEYVRRANGGKWILLKKYGTFNPYYIPAIIYPNNNIFLLWDFLRSYFKNSSITPEIFSTLPFVKNPGLELEGVFFKNNFFGYKII
jgi:hypothetical protein